MKPAVLAPAAQDELTAAAEWYEGRAVGLGTDFVNCVHDVLVRLSESPAAFPTWDRDPRFKRFVVPSFPYVIFYRELSDQVQIVAIAHGAREPGYWMRR
jgi:plasmid stabilization system protein ParE